MRKVSHIYAEMVRLDDGCVMDFSLSKNLYVYYYYQILTSFSLCNFGDVGSRFCFKIDLSPLQTPSIGPTPSEQN